MDKDWYKDFVKLASKEVRKMDEKRRKMLGYKRLDEVTDVDVHCEIHFDDSEESVLMLYFRDDTFIAAEVIDYDKFVDICTD